jgi:hypothetical protein
MRDMHLSAIDDYQCRRLLDPPTSVLEIMKTIKEVLFKALFCFFLEFFYPS